MTQLTANGFVSGLEDVIAAQTKLSHVEGLKGELTIAGYAIEELASRAQFEEMIFLLWNGNLPDEHALSSFATELAEKRSLPQETIHLLKAAARRRLPVMDVLMMGTPTLSLGPGPGDQTDRSQARWLAGQIPTIVASYWRLLHGMQPVLPRQDLGHAANFLYMLDGQSPDEARVRGLNTYLNTVIDHGLNASTFTARVIIATDSDLVAAVTGAIGALKGPRHGGAPGPALDTVLEIQYPERAEPILREKLENGQRLMGFGHRVYKVRDPRATILAEEAERFYSVGGDQALYELAGIVEETAIRLLAEYKPGRRLQTNVEFYTALLLHGLGLESALFSPVFAMSRVAGWIAHCFEQQETGRLIRPKAQYVGASGRHWHDLAQRTI